MARGRKINRRPQIRANCVFCKRPSVTKQHLWPDWIKKVIPREGKGHYQNIMRMAAGNSGTVILQPDIKFNRGPFGARKIRKVCGKCNSGWMSKLETAAKPAMVKMIKGESTSLNSEELLSISSWAVMTSIVAEYTDPPTLAIPEQDRSHIMENGSPPDNWHVWIGSYNGSEWKQRYRHTGMACVPDDSIRPSYIACNTQVSTFVIGSLLIHASSSTLPNVYPAFHNGIKNKLLKIWPSTPVTAEWPYAGDINDEQARQISDTLFKQLRIWGNTKS